MKNHKGETKSGKALRILIAGVVYIFLHFSRGFFGLLCQPGTLANGFL